MLLDFLPVYKKELKNYLQSPGVYVVAGLFFVLAGLFFHNMLIFFSELSINPQLRYRMGFYNLNFTQFVVQNTFSLINFLLLFIIPILTMRLFAEEKKTKTFELLVTYPLRDWDILLGKYLAALSMVVGILVISASYVIVMLMVGKPEIPVILSSYAGLFLLSMAYVAYGIFASSVTENQIVASIVTFTGLFIFYLIGDLTTTRAGFWVDIMEELSMRLHSVNFTMGLIDTKDIAFFVLFSCFFIFLTARVLESRRWRV